MFIAIEPTTRQFSGHTGELLLAMRSALAQAERDEEKAATTREEIEGFLIDLFGLLDVPGDAAYKLTDRGACSQVLSLELGVEYVPDGEAMAHVLGDRIHEVMTLRPHFDPVKAALAVETGIVTEAELAQCLQPIAHPCVTRYSAGEQDAALKELKAGEGRVKPLDLPKGLTLQWGERG